MAKLNIFISQPMNGLSEREILAERDRIEEVLHKLFPNDELEFVSGYTSDKPCMLDPEKERIYRLGNSISLMATADYIFFPIACERVRGCRVERKVAEEYNIPIIREASCWKPTDGLSDEELITKYDIQNFGGNKL